jgi:hypothetical protein
MLAVENVLWYFHTTATFCSALVTSEFWEFQSTTEFAIDGHLISARLLVTPQTHSLKYPRQRSNFKRDVYIFLQYQRMKTYKILVNPHIYHPHWHHEYDTKVVQKSHILVIFFRITVLSPFDSLNITAPLITRLDWRVLEINRTHFKVIIIYSDNKLPVVSIASTKSKKSSFADANNISD